MFFWLGWGFWLYTFFYIVFNLKNMIQNIVFHVGFRCNKYKHATYFHNWTQYTKYLFWKIIFRHVISTQNENTLFLLYLKEYFHTLKVQSYILKWHFNILRGCCSHILKGSPKPWKGSPTPWKGSPTTWKGNSTPWKGTLSPWKGTPTPWNGISRFERAFP